MFVADSLSRPNEAKSAASVKHCAAVEYYIDSICEDLVPDIHEIEAFEAAVTDEVTVKFKQYLVEGWPRNQQS